MVGPFEVFIINGDTFLRLQAFDQFFNIVFRHNAVGVAMCDQATGRTGGQKAKIVKIGGRGEVDCNFGENLGLRRKSRIKVKISD